MRLISFRTVALLLSRAIALLLVCGPLAYGLFFSSYIFHNPPLLREGNYYIPGEWSLLNIFWAYITNGFFRISYLLTLCVAYALWRPPSAKRSLALTIPLRVVLVLFCLLLLLVTLVDVTWYLRDFPPGSEFRM